MLGPGEEIINRYVADSQVRFVFWHNLDGFETATSLHVAAQCLGQQDPALFWQAHDYIYNNQRALFSVDRAGLTAIASAVGGDTGAFDACVDDGSGRQQTEAIDDITKSRGIRSRPIFDIEGTQLFGAQPYETFARVIDEALME